MALGEALAAALGVALALDVAGRVPACEGVQGAVGVCVALAEALRVANAEGERVGVSFEEREVLGMGEGVPVRLPSAVREAVLEAVRQAEPVWLLLSV